MGRGTGRETSRDAVIKTLFDQSEDATGSHSIKRPERFQMSG